MHLWWLLSQTHQQTHVQANLSFNHGTTEMHSLGFDNMRVMLLTKTTNLKTTHHVRIRWGKAHQWNTTKETCGSATLSPQHEESFLVNPKCSHTPTEQKFGSSRASNTCQAGPSFSEQCSAIRLAQLWAERSLLHHVITTSKHQSFGSYGWRTCRCTSLLLLFSLLLNAGQSSFRHFYFISETTKLIVATFDQRKPCLGCTHFLRVHAAPVSLELLGFIQ